MLRGDEWPKAAPGCNLGFLSWVPLPGLYCQHAMNNPTLGVDSSSGNR